MDGATAEALEALSELLAKSEVRNVATTGVGAGKYVLLGDEEADNGTVLIADAGRELFRENETISSEDNKSDEDEDVRIDEVANKAVEVAIVDIENAV